MGCHDSGNTWVYTSVLGSLFTMFHMMSILMQCMMVMHVFHCVEAKHKKRVEAALKELKEDGFV